MNRVRSHVAAAALSLAAGVYLYFAAVRLLAFEGPVVARMVGLGFLVGLPFTMLQNTLAVGGVILDSAWMLLPLGLALLIPVPPQADAS